MLPVSPTLVAATIEASRTASAEPYVVLSVADRDAGLPRLRAGEAASLLHAGAEPDGPAALALPDDGSLVRARIDASTRALLVQRIADPLAPGADFTAWSSLGTVDVSSGVAAGVALHAAGAIVLLASYEAGAVRVRQSTDGGATFAAASVLIFAGGVTAVAIATRADGSALAAWATGGVVSVAQRASDAGGGAWGSPAAWSHTLSEVTSLALGDVGDWALAVGGLDPAGGAGLWLTVYGSGWLALTPLAHADAASSVRYRADAVFEAGTARVLLAEQVAGSFDTMLVASALAESGVADGAWRDPLPLGLEAAYRLGAGARTGEVWLSSASDVRRSAIAGASSDLSERVLTLRYEASARERPGSERLEATLDASNTSPGSGGPLDALEPGAQVEVAFGYSTPGAGVEAGAGRALRVTSLRQDAATVRVVAEGAATLLQAWRAPRTLTWARGAASVPVLATALGAYAGVVVEDGGVSAQAHAETPGGIVRVGQHGHAALRAALAVVPDLAISRGAHLVLIEARADALPADAVASFEDDAGAISGAVAVSDAGTSMIEPPSGWARWTGDPATGVAGTAVDADRVRAGGGLAVAVDEAVTSVAALEARAGGHVAPRDTERGTRLDRVRPRIRDWSPAMSST